ncbi:MAG: type II toxin-antitoxin system VapC family toxin [Desulfobacterales bacterium]
MLSSIVVAELFAGVKEGSEQTVLESFISLFRVIPVTSEIATVGGFFKRDYGKSHGVGLADAIIAATSQVENAELKTLNPKHYPMIIKLIPAYKKVMVNGLLTGWFEHQRKSSRVEKMVISATCGNMFYGFISSVIDLTDLPNDAFTCGALSVLHSQPFCRTRCTCNSYAV